MICFLICLIHQWLCQLDYTFMHVFVYWCVMGLSSITRWAISWPHNKTNPAVIIAASNNISGDVVGVLVIGPIIGRGARLWRRLSLAVRLVAIFVVRSLSDYWAASCWNRNIGHVEQLNTTCENKLHIIRAKIKTRDMLNNCAKDMRTAALHMIHTNKLHIRHCKIDTWSC